MIGFGKILLNILTYLLMYSDREVLYLYTYIHAYSAVGFNMVEKRRVR